MAAEKRIPGQSNAQFEAGRNPNSGFLGTQSLQGGGDPTFAYRGLRAIYGWLDRRRSRRTR